jgi:hypothetical protein
LSPIPFLNCLGLCWELRTSLEPIDCPVPFAAQLRLPTHKLNDWPAWTGSPEASKPARYIHNI